MDQRLEAEVLFDSVYSILQFIVPFILSGKVITDGGYLYFQRIEPFDYLILSNQNIIQFLIKLFSKRLNLVSDHFTYRNNNIFFTVFS